jgi:hypothetical protein
VQPDIWPRRWGYKIRIYIEADKELQELGCGWGKVIVELDGGKVHVHHNGRVATMKRDAFKKLLARNKRRKRPQLKIVVSNLPNSTRGSTMPRNAELAQRDENLDVVRTSHDQETGD